MLANKSSLTQEAISCYTAVVSTEDIAMPAVMNVNEAKANFSGMLSEVESGQVSFTIMRYGRPIARVVPVERSRKIRPLPGSGTNWAGCFRG